MFPGVYPFLLHFLFFSGARVRICLIQYGDGAAVLLDDSQDGVDRGAFDGSVFADQPDDAAPGHLKGYIVQ